MAHGFAYIAGAMSQDTVLHIFGELEMKDGGFVGEEVRRMMNKNHDGKLRSNN